MVVLVVTALSFTHRRCEPPLFSPSQGKRATVTDMSGCDQGSVRSRPLGWWPVRRNHGAWAHLDSTPSSRLEGLVMRARSLCRGRAIRATWTLGNGSMLPRNSAPPAWFASLTLARCNGSVKNQSAMHPGFPQQNHSLRDGSTPVQENAILATGLVKRFGDVHAVDGVDLRVQQGTIYGMLGPNGAGKTTLVRLLSTLLEPDAGRALVLGHDVVQEARAVRRSISLTGQFASVDEELSGQENLILVARLLGFSHSRAKARAEELLKAFGLEDASKREVRTYSGGLRRRLDIAASIIRTPDLLFLDEPTTGLDPHSRSGVWDMVRALVERGTTVLLTTQYLEEADQLADRIAVMDRGRVIAEGSSAELKASVGRGFVHVRFVDSAVRESARALLADSCAGSIRECDDPRALVIALSEPARAAELLALLVRARIEISHFSLGQASLNEVFFALTGRGTVATGAETSTAPECGGIP